MVFFGEFTISFTSGGRLVLPKRLREGILGNVIVLTKGFDNCLSGFSKEDWEERSKEFLTTSLLDTQNLALKRILFSGAVYSELDEQGRLVLPHNLIEYSKIKEKALVIGVGDHFEIWAAEEWERYLRLAQTKTKVLEKNEK